MKKIFLVIPTLQQGGAERVISELANQFSQQGVEVHLTLLAKAEDFYSIDSNVIVHRLGFVNTSRVQKVVSEIKTFIKLRKLFKEHKPDAVLSFMDKYNVFTILASRFLNLRVFVSDRSNPKLKLRPSMFILKKLTYRHATGIIAQTSLAKELLVKFTGNNNVHVIQNPVKKIQLYPNIQREKIILNMGRLVPEKGQKYLLQAFSNLNLDDWKLVVLGDGPLRPELEKQVLELGLEGKVIMPGSVNNVDEWLAKAKIFAFSSISEGFPNALVEAMAAGLPCVSFDCDAGPRDIIINGINGLLTPQGDINELTSNISLLVNNTSTAKKLAKNAVLVREEYNMESIATEYLSFIIDKRPI